MFNMENADKIYDEKMRKDPRFAEKFIKKFRNLMPEIYTKAMYEEEYGCHIVDTKLYDDAISLLEWSDDKGYGAKWDVKTILKLSDIDFDSEEIKFYELDYAYVVNMLYSDYCHIFTEPTYYLKMAKAYLMDSDYPGVADERAYHNAIKRINYFKNK